MMAVFAPERRGSAVNPRCETGEIESDGLLCRKF